MRKTNAYIGAAINRLEDARFLTGRGQYVGDIARAGLLHAVILRSPVAHGIIRGVRTDAALELPGLRAILTAADIGTRVPRIPMRQEPMPELVLCEQPVIAEAKVRYVGEPVAIIIADNADLAEDAASRIDLDIEVLPPVMSSRGDVLLFDDIAGNIAASMQAVRGDAEAAFNAHSSYTRRERFQMHRHTAVMMEGRGLLAEWDANASHMTLYGAAKVPFPNRRILARFLGLPESGVALIENDVGGGFGARGEFYPEDFLVPFAARALGAPVRWIEDRRENLLATNHAREAECTLEIACAPDGTIIALRGEAIADIGAYVRTVGATPPRNIISVLSGPYRIPHIGLSVSLALTNKTPAGTYRGPGRAEADFFRERLFDIVAGELGIDPVEFRRRNLIARAEHPYRLATVLRPKILSETDSGDYTETLDRCLAEFDWTGKKTLDGKIKDGRHHGIAIGCYFEGGASGPRENARLRIETDGTVSVFVGSSAVGQGLETVFAQIAADAMEVPLAQIRGVFHGSTDLLHEGFGAYSSRSTVMGGSAIIAAANALREKIRVHGHSGDLEASGTFESSKRTYSYGAHAAHVAVDAETGHIALIDYVAVEDVGRIVNPATLHGQTLGAIVQGLGGALMEHLVYDGNGQLLTTTLADYLMPTACDFPHIEVFALENHPNPHNPLGAKGAGEGGIIPVAGVIANAVASALRAFDVQPNALPLSPPKIFRLIREAETRLSKRNS